VTARLVDGEPIAVETIHVPSDLEPGIRVADVEAGSFYTLLRERYGITPTEAEQYHEAMAANDTEAALLGVSPGFPLLLLDRITRDQNGRVFECTRAVYRGDRYRVVSKPTLTDEPNAANPAITPIMATG
jgi:GntR family transcriptional regulator